jgi:hypothetical protein
LKQGDKILVVVDDVHSGRTSAIFYAMDIIISSFNYIENIIFLLAATLQKINISIIQTRCHTYLTIHNIIDDEPNSWNNNCIGTGCINFGIVPLL